MEDEPTLLADEAPASLRQVSAEGLNPGEVYGSAADVSSLAVHFGARVGAAAGPGEILLSGIVRGLMYGSDLVFVDKGAHELKGIPDSWDLFALDDDVQRPVISTESPNTTAADRAALRPARHAPALTRFSVKVGNTLQRRRAATSWRISGGKRGARTAERGARRWPSQLNFKRTDRGA